MTGVTGVSGDIVQQAAAVMHRSLDWHNDIGDVCEVCKAQARALAAAGLLAVPAAPAATVTIPVEQAEVLAAAERWANADAISTAQPYGTGKNVWAKVADRLLPDLLDAARANHAAVDRLAAGEETT